MFAANGTPVDLKCNDTFAGKCNNYWQENAARPDWPGASLGPNYVFNIPGCSAGITSCGSASSHLPVPDDGTEKYAVTFVLAADANARGTYTITVDPLNIAGNFMQVANGTVLAYAKVIPAKVTIPTGACCFNLGPNTQCQDNVTHLECQTGHVGQVLFRTETRCPPVGPSCAPDCPLNPAICNDLDLCTTDTCHPVFDCQHELIPAFNDPANQCCDPATGVVVARDDQNECTDDRCSRGGDRGVAEHIPVPDGSLCDDGNPATGTELCIGGVCTGIPPVPGTPYFRLVPVPPQGSAAPPYPPGTVLDPAHGTATFPSRPQRIWLEIRLGGWGSHLVAGLPALLRSWQASIEQVSLDEYPDGLHRPFISCMPVVDELFCQSEIGVGGGSRCGGTLGLENRCATAFLDSARSDVVGPGFGSCIQFPSSCGGGSLGGQNGKLDGGLDYYGGTVVIDAPAAIAGTVQLGFGPNSVGQNFMMFPGAPPFPGNAILIVPPFIPATLIFPVGRCCTPLGRASCVDSVTPAECEALGVGTIFQADATCQGDGNGDGIDDACFAVIPAASQWGLLILSLGLLVLTKVFFGLRRPDRPAGAA